jgi:hypothetical protein
VVLQNRILGELREHRFLLWDSDRVVCEETRHGSEIEDTSTWLR